MSDEQQSQQAAPAIIQAQQEEETQADHAAPASQFEDWQSVMQFKAARRASTDNSGGSEWEVLSPTRVSRCGSTPRSLSAHDCSDPSEATAAADAPEVKVDISVVGDAAQMSLNVQQEPGAVARGPDTPEKEDCLQGVLDCPGALAGIEAAADAFPPPQIDYAVEDVHGNLSPVTLPTETDSYLDEVAPSMQEVATLDSPTSVAEAAVELPNMQQLDQATAAAQEHRIDIPAEVEADTEGWMSDSDLAEGAMGPRSEPDSEGALKELQLLSQEGSLDDLSELVSECSGVVVDEPAQDVDSDMEAAGVIETPLVGGEPASIASLAQQEYAPEDGVGSKDGSSDFHFHPLNKPKRSTLDCVSHKLSATMSKIAASGVVARLWTWLQELTASVRDMVPAGAYININLYVAKLKAKLKQLDWAPLTLGAGMALLGALLVTVLCENRKLTRQMRMKDKELTKLIMRIYNLQEALTGSRRIPIIRHTCAMTAFPAADML